MAKSLLSPSGATFTPESAYVGPAATMAASTDAGHEVLENPSLHCSATGDHVDHSRLTTAEVGLELSLRLAVGVEDVSWAFFELSQGVRPPIVVCKEPASAAYMTSIKMLGLTSGATCEGKHPPEMENQGSRPSHCPG